MAWYIWTRKSAILKGGDVHFVIPILWLSFVLDPKSNMNILFSLILVSFDLGFDKNTITLF